MGEPRVRHVKPSACPMREGLGAWRRTAADDVDWTAVVMPGPQLETMATMARRLCTGVDVAVAKVGLAVALGLLIALSGLASYAVFPTVLRTQVEANMVLEPGNEMFSNWERVPVPIYVSYYVFNVTNPVAILEGREKARLEEVGPYTFRETRVKMNVTWQENGTLSYRQVKRYHFQPDRTQGSLDDAVITLNVPMVSAAYATKYQEEDFKSTVSSMITGTNSTFFICKRIRELLFDGYEDEIIEVAKEMDIQVPADRFGWAYGKNGTDDGVYSIFSGLKGMEHYGFLDRFDGMSEMTAFHGHCNSLNGTTGDLWPPLFLDHAHSIDLFVRDLCRSIKLRYLTDVVFHRVKLRRYWADHQLFNYSLPENRCFCSETCFASGVLNISACQHGNPVVVSYPHFLYADPSYQEAVDGLKPDPSKHLFFLDIEPKMGLPVQASVRLQVNVWLERIEGMEQFENITELIFYPMFWMENLASADEETLSRLRLVTEELPQYVNVASFGAIAIGGTVLLATLIYAIRYTKRPRRVTRTEYIPVTVFK